MRRELLISAGPGEWRAALLEDGVAVELGVERGHGKGVGSIHLGRVLRSLPALGATLIDIGGDRPAFLPQSEIFPRRRRLDEGARVVVQIRREAQGGKAVRLTTAVALRGKIVEMIAGRPGLTGDEMLPSETRARLLGIVEFLTRPAPLSGNAGKGADLRAATRREAGEGSLRQTAIGLRLLESGAGEMAIEEAGRLAECWRDIGERAARLDRPGRLDPAATFAAALAGRLPPVGLILVDDPAAIPEIRAAFPDAAVEHLPEAEWPIDLDALLDDALSPTIVLAGGGSVHIEATRTAVMIDVDTGTPETGSPQRTALAINVAAAAVVARQVRLRNLGGAIVVDFVGLDDRGARERLCAVLARGLAADPARPQILGWTRHRHLELVRPRRVCPLTEVLLEAPPGGGLVKTAVTVAHEALRALRREATRQPGHRWRLTVAPEVAAVLADDAADAMRALEQRSGREIAIAVDPGCDHGRFQIIPI